MNADIVDSTYMQLCKMTCMQWCKLAKY